MPFGQGYGGEVASSLWEETGGELGRCLLNQTFHREIHNVLPSDSVGSKRGRKTSKKLTEVSEYIIVTGNIFMSERKNEWMRTWWDTR